jgi:hypothetical protein
MAMWNGYQSNLSRTQVPGYSQVLPICIVVLLADVHTFKSDKRVYKKRMLGIEFP